MFILLYTFHYWIDHLPFTFLLLNDSQKQTTTHKIWIHSFGLHLTLAFPAVIRQINRTFDEQAQDLRGNCITKDSQGCLVAYLIHRWGQPKSGIAEKDIKNMRQDCGRLPTGNAKNFSFEFICHVLTLKKVFMCKEVKGSRSYNICQEEQTHPQTKASLFGKRRHFTRKGQTQGGTFVQKG